MEEKKLYYTLVEDYLSKILGPQTAHHLILRFCNDNFICLEDLQSPHLPLLGKFLKKNLDFFLGKDRAIEAAEKFGAILLSVQTKRDRVQSMSG